jgi:hypothetical protein
MVVGAAIGLCACGGSGGGETAPSTTSASGGGLTNCLTKAGFTEPKSFVATVEVNGTERIAARRIYKYAARRMNWHGVQTLALLESGERPKTTAAAKHRLFTDHELTQTLAAAREPFRTLFVFAATTGARISECLGLVWADIDLVGIDRASVSFEFQAARHGGVRVELKRRKRASGWSSFQSSLPRCWRRTRSRAPTASLTPSSFAPGLASRWASATSAER